MADIQTLTDQVGVLAATIGDVQQVFTDNFPIKSTVVMFSDTDYPWNSNQNVYMTFRSIAVHEVTQNKWIQYKQGDPTSPANWSSLTSDVTSNLIGGSGIEINVGTNGSGIIDLDGDITKDVTLTGTDNNAYDFKISGIKDFSVAGKTAKLESGIYSSTDYSGLTVDNNDNDSNYGPSVGMATANSSLTDSSIIAINANSGDHNTISIASSKDTNTNIASIKLSAETGVSHEIDFNVKSASGDNENINMSTSGIIITSDVGGLYYDDDYHTSNVNNDRWIPDKKYVDDQIGSVTLNDGSGTVYDSGNKAVNLGGTLSQAANIDGNNQQFSVTDANKITLSAGSTEASLVLDSTLSTAKLTSANELGLESTAGNAYLKAHGTTTIQSATGTLTLGSTHTFADSSNVGLQYAGDYETNFVAKSLVTKKYVDSVATGLNIKEAVEVVSDVPFNITNGGTTTIDGVSLAVDDRVLLAGQGGDINTPHKDNGIYLVKSGAWVRSDDANESDEINDGTYVFVKQGTSYADTGWVQINDVSAIGTDTQQWTLFTRSGFIEGGQGIVVDANTVKVDLADASGLTFDATTDAGKLKIDLEEATSSGLRTTTDHGLELALHNYNAGSDVIIQTTNHDLLLSDSSGANAVSYVGITSSASTYAPANKVGFGTKNGSGTTTIESNLVVGRDDNNIDIYRKDPTNDTNKYIKIQDGSISLGIETGSTPTDAVKIEGTTAGALSLLATTTFNLDFNGDATIKDNRAAGSQKGLEYAGDYSASFSDYSLITKGYMEEYVTSHATVEGGSGLTLDASTSGVDTMNLGGDLTQNATISVTDYTFKVEGKTASTTYLEVNSSDEILLVGGQNELKVTSGASGIEIKGQNTAAGSGASTIDVQWDSIKVTGTVANFKGIEYNTDYSSDFSDLSLINKGYMVDYVSQNATVNGGSGLTLDASTSGPDTMNLGGDLTQDATIDGKTAYKFEVLNATEATLSATTTKIESGTANNITVSSAGVINTSDTKVDLVVTSGDKLSIGSTVSTFTDHNTTANAEGLKYAADYQNLQDLSLVHKKYVDTEITTVEETINNLTATDISYVGTNGTAGNWLSATNVQDAIDELNSDLRNISVENGLTNTNGTISWGGTLDYVSTEVSRDNPAAQGTGNAISKLNISDRTGARKDVRIDLESNYYTTQSKISIDTEDLVISKTDNTGKITKLSLDEEGLILSDSEVGSITMSSDGATTIFAITDNRSGSDATGIQYANNYRDNFVDLSLVDKKFVTDYVDTNATVVAGSGLTKVSNASGPDTINLGGGMNQDAILDLNGNTFAVNGTSGSNLTYDGDSFTMNAADGNTIITTNSSGALSITSDTFTVTSNTSTTAKGIYYASNYATNAGDRWLTDKKYVDDTIGSSTRTAGKGLTDGTTATDLDVDTGDGLFIDSTDGNKVAVSVGQTAETVRVIDLSIDASKNVALDKDALVTGTNNLTASSNTATVFLAKGTVNSKDELGVAHDDLVTDLANSVLMTSGATGISLKESLDSTPKLVVDEADIISNLAPDDAQGTLIELNKNSTNTTIGVDKYDLVTNLSSTGVTTSFAPLSSSGSELGVSESDLIYVLSSGTNGSTHFVDLVDQGGQLGVDATEIATEINAQTKDLNQGNIWVGNASNIAEGIDASSSGNVLIGDGTTLNSVAISGDVTVDSSGNTTITNGAVTTDKLNDNAVTLAKLDASNIAISEFAEATSDISMGGYKITSLATPVAATDAVTKEYVDTVSSGLRAKAAVRYITDATISSFTDKNAVAAALDEVDGNDVVAGDIADGDRILVIWQAGDFHTGHADNGIYVWSDADGALVRADDFDGTPDGEVQLGDFVYVVLGDDGGNAQWVLVGPTTGSGTNGNNIVVGTDLLQFSPLAGPSIVNAGAGLTKFADTLAVDVATIGGLEFTEYGTSGSSTPTKDAKLKVKVDNATSVNNNFASVVNVGANGLNIAVDDVTIGQNSNNRLYVKDGGIDTDQLADDAVDNTKLDLGNGTTQINATTFLLTNDFGSGTNGGNDGTGLINGGDSVQDAIETLDNYVSGLSDVTAKSGSGITVESDGTIDFDGTLTKDANITGDSAAYSIYFGGNGADANRIKEFNIFTGNQTVGSSFKVDNDIIATAAGTSGLVGNVVTLNSSNDLDIYGEKSLTIRSKTPVVTDTSDNGGMLYAEDYSANYQNRSLVDKEYVDSKIAESESVIEEDVFNPFIDSVSTAGNDMIIKISSTVEYTFAYDPLEDITLFINGILEERGNAWDVVDPDNSYSVVPEGSEGAGDAIKWNNDVYYLESDDVVTIRYNRHSTTTGTNG